MFLILSLVSLFMLRVASPKDRGTTQCFSETYKRLLMDLFPDYSLYSRKYTPK